MILWQYFQVVFWFIPAFETAQYIMNKYELAPPTLWPERKSEEAQTPY